MAFLLFGLNVLPAARESQLTELTFGSKFEGLPQLQWQTKAEEGNPLAGVFLTNEWLELPEIKLIAGVMRLDTHPLSSHQTYRLPEP